MRSCPSGLLDGLAQSGRAVRRILGLFAIMRRIEDGAGARAGRARISEACRAILCLHGVECEIAGVPPPGPAVIVANHRSYLDAVLLAALAPAIPVAKIEAAAWPILGPALRRLGLLFVDRNDPVSGMVMMRRAVRLLELGESLLGFPEGTTGAGPGLLPLRAGLFAVAKRAKVPLVPVAIAYVTPGVDWLGDATFLPHYLALSSRPSIRAQVLFGAPIDSRPHLDHRSLMRAGRAALLEALRKLDAARPIEARLAFASDEDLRDRIAI